MTMGLRKHIEQYVSGRKELIRFHFKLGRKEKQETKFHWEIRASLRIWRQEEGKVDLIVLRLEPEPRDQHDYRVVSLQVAIGNSNDINLSI